MNTFITPPQEQIKKEYQKEITRLDNLLKKLLKSLARKPNHTGPAIWNILTGKEFTKQQYQAIGKGNK